MNALRMTEAQRLEQITKIERGYWKNGAVIAGMDEVGRGPLAGPVVVAAVILPPQPLIHGVKDSKLIASETRREELAARIREQAIAVGIGVVPREIIDEINILQATRRAFCMAFENLPVKPDHALVDALKDLGLSACEHALIHGDALSYLIGAASIVAKVHRDRMMREYHAFYPQYGFERNKGYGTAEHIAALREYGPCPLHRKTFIKKILEDGHERTG
ncbi:MAG: ribonuclease HII [Bacillota bacterium]